MNQNTFQQDEIRPLLIKYLTAAKQQIRLAIGWIDDDAVMSLLEKKVLEGVKVTLILISDPSFTAKKAYYKEYHTKGIHIIPFTESHTDYFIDHKFGLIDNKVVITGTYGWGSKKTPETYFANFAENTPSLITGFEKEFNYLSICQQLSKNETKPENEIVVFLKKLEVLKTLLNIGDTEFLDLRLEPLEAFKSDKNIANILAKIIAKEFDEALELIKTFTHIHQPLRACIDPPIDSYKREIQLLEDEISALSNQFSETQKLVHKFSKMHTDKLGDILQKLLYQTKLKAEFEAKQKQGDSDAQDDLDEATKDHEEYTKSHEAAKKEKLLTLTPAEQKELKKLYRHTSMKCHPDRVVEELHDQAEALFVELNAAYKANDLEKVRDISQQLKSGIMLPKSEGITELKKLKSTYNSLLQKLKDWQEKLDTLKQDASYRTISSIEDWEFYFEDKKQVLLAQLDRLKTFNEQEVNAIPPSE